MSWKMLLVVAALAIPAVGCKTLSTDGQQPNKPAVTEEKAAEPAAGAADPAKTEPAKVTEEGKAPEEGKAVDENKTDESKAAEPEGKSAEGGGTDPQ